MDYKRNRDLIRVFNDRWKANHNNDIQKMREKDNIRQIKIFSANQTEYLSEEDFNNHEYQEPVKSSMDIQLERLNRNMEALRQNRGNFNG